jgi:hypothetical protein
MLSEITTSIEEICACASSGVANTTDELVDNFKKEGSDWNMEVEQLISSYSSRKQDIQKKCQEFNKKLKSLPIHIVLMSIVSKGIPMMDLFADPNELSVLLTESLPFFSFYYKVL